MPRATLPHRPVAAALLGVLAAVTASCGPGAPSLPAIVPGGDEVRVIALNVAFEPTELRVPANRAFTLVLDNRDAGIPHDIAIRRAGDELLKSDVVAGPTVQRTPVPPLPAGVYQYACIVHPNMTGELVAVP